MLTTVILAGGQGTRMQSELPKVLNNLKEKALVDWVVALAEKINSDQIIVVVGYKKELVVKHLGDKYEYAIQEEQNGTGHAVSIAEKQVRDGSDTVLILNGDVPLLKVADLESLISLHRDQRAGATLLTAEAPPNSKGYGRIIRKSTGEVEKIVEERDANEEERKITEVNTGTYCFDKKYLFEYLKQVGCHNDQKEYYLTDVIEILNKAGLKVLAYKSNDWQSIIGTNTLEELRLAEKILEER